MKRKTKTAEKIMGQCFPVKSKVKCKNLAHLAEKKKQRPKKSFSLLTQAPLQCKVQKRNADGNRFQNMTSVSVPDKKVGHLTRQSNWET